MSEPFPQYNDIRESVKLAFAALKESYEELGNEDEQVDKKELGNREE